MKIESIICRGLPTSGKTTWAKQFVKLNQNWCIISRAAISDMLNMQYENNEIVDSIFYKAITNAYDNGINIIFDDINLDPIDVTKIRTYLADLSTDIKITENLFKISLREALYRDYVRGDISGTKLIHKLFKKYFGELKTKDDEYYLLDSIPDSLNISYAEQYSHLEPAIIIDIDGTISKRVSRSPYEYDKVYEDEINYAVASIIIQYALTGHKLLFVSGRDSICRDDTLRWLKDKFFGDKNLFHKVMSTSDSDQAANKLYDMFKTHAKHFILLMRTKGDKRKDTIIKKELYLNNIHQKYAIKAIFDDRDSVVQMWRGELELPCFQVNHGNF